MEHSNIRTMDEKSPDDELPSYTSSRPRASQIGSMLMRMRLAIVGLLALFFVLVHTRNALEVELDSQGRIIRPGQVSLASEAVEEWKVPLDVHIMSKCPDALDCLSKLIVPSMSQVSDKVNLTLSYIGTVTSDHDVLCKHGAQECLGNILELCAINLYPDPKQYLGFTLCMTKEYEKIPERELVHNCALESGISFDKLNDCASSDDGAHGMGLLRDSVEHSQSVNASISCTVRLNGRERCIRDGGEWQDCERGSSVRDLVGDIEELWNQKNGEAGKE